MHEKKKMTFFSKSHKNPGEIMETMKANMVISEKQDKKIGHELKQ